MKHYVAYVCARSAAGIVNSIPLTLAMLLASLFARLLLAISKRYRNITLGNLRQAFPEKTEQQRKRIAHASMAHLMQLGVEVSRLPKLLTAENMAERIDESDLDPRILEWAEQGKPMILATAHHGNWEIAGYGFCLHGYPIHAVARPIKNPYTYEWITSIRKNKGLHLITKSNAIPACQEVLRDQGIVGMVADQNAGKHGEFVPFFGRLASAHRSVARLALRYGCPVVVAGCIRTAPGKYAFITQDIILPEDAKQHNDPGYYITARCALQMECIIRAHPEQYLWAHRRWKTRPKWERDSNGTVPESFKNQLRSLPWLDADQINKLLSNS